MSPFPHRSRESQWNTHLNTFPSVRWSKQSASQSLEPRQKTETRNDEGTQQSSCVSKNSKSVVHLKPILFLPPASDPVAYLASGKPFASFSLRTHFWSLIPLFVTLGYWCGVMSSNQAGLQLWEWASPTGMLAKWQVPSLEMLLAHPATPA